MEYKELKKKFRKLCKKEKRSCYNYILLGGFLAILGFVTVLMTFILAKRLVIGFPTYQILFAVGCIFAVIGLILYFIGERIFNKEFMYINKKMSENRKSKIVRKATRAFLIEDNKILAIQYNKKDLLNYFDIPGGKIEEDETSKQASFREFKEKTGLTIINQSYKGHVIIEYPNKTFDTEIFIVNDYEGTIEDFEENTSLWMSIEELLQKDKILPSIEVIKYLDNDIIDLKLTVDDNHKIIDIENYNEVEKNDI